ncbi:hypothetical protein [Salinicoccus sp. HZC-1]|uniref:hypothetical protein n=1 Tax=Salinicoccus sp. HZC-1 TaxID=3385497 RepID=UPI00398AB76F
MNYSVDDAIADLDKIPAEIDLYDRMIEVSAIITRLMAEHIKESDMPTIVRPVTLLL